MFFLKYSKTASCKKFDGNNEIDHTGSYRCIENSCRGQAELFCEIMKDLEIIKSIFVFFNHKKEADVSYEIDSSAS